MKIKHIGLLCAALMTALLCACSRTAAEPPPTAEAAVAPANAPASTALTAQSESGGDAPYYEMSLTLDTAVAEVFDPFTLSGTVNISFTNTSGDVWQEICLRDYSSAMLAADALSAGNGNFVPQTAITSVSENGTALSFRAQDDATVVTVTLASPMEPGERRTLTVSFSEQIPCGGYRTGYFPTASDMNHCVISLGPFFPVLSVYENGQWLQNPYFAEGECFYTQCGSYAVELTLPAEYTVVSTGEETDNGGGSWTLTASDVRDFAIVACDNYMVCTAEAEGVTVRSWYYADSKQDALQGQESLEAAVEAVSAYTAAYGVYPYDTLDVVESTYDYGGMEYPTMVRISGGYAYALTADGGGEEDDSLRSCVAHEVAHQWFYGVVGNDQYGEAWLDEGFARFSEMVWLEAIGADAALRDDMVSGWANTAAEYDGVLIAQPYSSFEQTGGYGQVVYDKSAIFLYSLRSAMGEDVFSSFIRSWYADHIFAEVTTDDFRAAVLAACPENSEAATLLTEYLG